MPKTFGLPTQTAYVGLCRRYLSFYLVLFLVGTETFLVSPLLPAITDDLHISIDLSSTIVLAYVLVYAICAPFLGGVTDRFGRRTSVLIGGSIFLIGNILVANSPGIILIVAGRAVAGLGAALAGPAIWAHLADTSSPNERGQAMGAGMAAFSLGQIIGVPFGGVIADNINWRVSFWMISLIALLAVCGTYRQTRNTPTTTGTSAFSVGVVFRLWGNPVLRHALVLTLVFHAANLGCYAFLGALMHYRFALSTQTLGLIGIVVGTGSFAGALLGGKIVDKVRQKNGDAVCLPVWCLLLAVGITGAAQAPFLVISLIGIVLWFLASGAFVTNQQTLLVNAAPAARATSSSWNTATMHIGTALGVLVLTSFSDLRIGTLLFGGITSLIAVAIALALHARLLLLRSTTLRRL
ncbi:MAG: MFS transporter [Pseudonocardiaceae bacterium]